MDKKTFIWIILAIIIIPIILYLGFIIFQNQKISPGIKGLSKYKVGVFYCSYNDEIPSLAEMIKTRLNAKTFQIKPAVPYPKDPQEFKNRIKKDNKDISKVVIDVNKEDLRKYDYIIFGTPVMEDSVCPELKRFIINNQKRIENKPVSVLVLYKKGELPANTLLFFKSKLYNAIWKPGFITEMRSRQQLNYEFDLWFNLMQFKRKELSK